MRCNNNKFESEENWSYFCLYGVMKISLKMKSNEIKFFKWEIMKLSFEKKSN
jgi:hypothetical protein